MWYTDCIKPSVFKYSISDSDSISIKQPFVLCNTVTLAWVFIDELLTHNFANLLTNVPVTLPVTSQQKGH